jgi:hypothetical protein
MASYSPMWLRLFCRYSKEHTDDLPGRSTVLEGLIRGWLVEKFGIFAEDS